MKSSVVFEGVVVKYFSMICKVKKFLDKCSKLLFSSSATPPGVGPGQVHDDGRKFSLFDKQRD